jgi:hypothetical protein
MQDHIRPAVARAGISKHVTWHTFRHTFSTLLMAQEDILSFIPMAAVEEESGRLDTSVHLFAEVVKFSCELQSQHLCFRNSGALGETFCQIAYRSAVLVNGQWQNQSFSSWSAQPGALKAACSRNSRFSVAI